MRNRNFQRLMGMAGMLVGVFLVLDLLVLPWYVDQGATVDVPSVVGLSYEDARALLDSARVSPIQAEIRADPRIPPGSVCDQNPPGGTRVKEGRRVYLSISGGEVLVPVPRLKGLSTRDARFALERAGLHLGEMSYAPSDVFFENTIMEQAVAVGTKIRKGSSIGVTVSQGTLRDEVIVPELTGKTLAEAEGVLRGLHLQLGRISYQSGLDLIPNTIVDQFPRAGDPIAPGGSVDLFVAQLSGNRDRSNPEEH